MNRQHSAMLVSLALLFWAVLTVVVIFWIQIPDYGYGYFSETGMPTPCVSRAGDYR